MSKFLNSFIDIEMKIIKIKPLTTYIFIFFVSLFLGSCSAYKSCDCPGLGQQDSNINRSENS